MKAKVKLLIILILVIIVVGLTVIIVKRPSEQLHIEDEETTEVSSEVVETAPIEQSNTGTPARQDVKFDYTNPRNMLFEYAKEDFNADCMSNMITQVAMSGSISSCGDFDAESLYSDMLSAIDKDADTYYFKGTYDDENVVISLVTYEDRTVSLHDVLIPY